MSNRSILFSTTRFCVKKNIHYISPCGRNDKTVRFVVCGGGGEAATSTHSSKYRFGCHPDEGGISCCRFLFIISNLFLAGTLYVLYFHTKTNRTFYLQQKIYFIQVTLSVNYKLHTIKQKNYPYAPLERLSRLDSMLLKLCISPLQ